MAKDVASSEETAALLSQTPSERVEAGAVLESTTEQHLYNARSAATVLPLALLSALAMAATAATQIYTYASLLCDDAQHCHQDEQRKFAGSVAIATTVANGCALLALGGFEKLSKTNRKAGLGLWIIVRSLGVVALSLGLSVQSILVALSSQVFEGLASDNILHFSLNAIYVQVSDQRSISRLIGSSLALYMVGISVSPSVASLLSNFQASFTMAYALFAIALLYLVFGVQSGSRAQSGSDQGQAAPHPAASTSTSRGWRLFKATSSPFLFFAEDAWRLMPGLSLLLYNTIQSYTFTAIMVHTSIHLGFTSKENGFLLSITHAVASSYLLLVLFVAPWISKLWSKRRSSSKQTPSEVEDRKRMNAVMALISLLFQAGSLLLFAFAEEPWQVYVISAMLALGLASPSFIKSYFVAHFGASERPRAVAGLAAMETIGSLAAPVVVGGVQAIWPGREMFFVAAGGVCISCVLLYCSLVTSPKPIEDS